MRRELPAAAVPVAVATFAAGTFVVRRGAARWVTHAPILWGRAVSLPITLPLRRGQAYYGLLGKRFVR